MPVTKTAKRALRSSKKKFSVNSAIRANLETAIRLAKKSKSVKQIVTAVKLADRAVKKRVIHNNKAGRIKSMLSKLASKTKVTPKKKTSAKKK